MSSLSSSSSPSPSSLSGSSSSSRRLEYGLGFSESVSEQGLLSRESRSTGGQKKGPCSSSASRCYERGRG
eukprot:5676352-Prorocentrum_lima.AAC.1